MINLRKTYIIYKKNVKNFVNLQDYLELTAAYNKHLIDLVLQGFIVPLPYRMGSLQIQGKKEKVVITENNEVKGLAPDWVKTKQLWSVNEEAKKNKKLVYHSNLATDGIRYKYFWSKNKVLLVNKYLYSLVLSRYNKRAVHTEIKKGREYITVL